MRVAHIKMSEEVMSYDCPKCGSGGATVVGGYHNGWLPMSRREQRRARKAKKNLVMYKTEGRRPWSSRSMEWPISQRLCDAYEDHMNRLAHHNYRLEHLREPSGFVSMSRVAEEMRLTKAHAPAFVDEAVTYTGERFKDLLAKFTSDVNAAASAGESIYDLRGEE